MSAKHKVTIIEPSEIVSAGLKQLVEYGGNFHVTKIFKSIQDYSENPNGNPDIILINPTALNIGDSNDLRNIISAKDNVAIVAFCYLAYNEETLHNYDSCIGMFCTQEQIEKKLLSALKTTSDKEQDDNSNELSTRECEILTAVAKGKTNKEIADEFNISIHTVISHRKNISHKLGINSIAGLTIYAVMNKLLDVEDF
ncbi:MAG: response regulator transcription factor [Bacteroidales bacterium]|nr:response regulator transcription factor [Bacteroidales bacterium]